MLTPAEHVALLDRLAVLGELEAIAGEIALIEVQYDVALRDDWAAWWRVRAMVVAEIARLVVGAGTTIH